MAASPDLIDFFSPILKTLPRESCNEVNFSHHIFPSNQERRFIANLVVTKGIHYFGSSTRIDRLYFSGSSQEYQALAIAMVYTIFCLEPEEPLVLELQHSESEIREIQLRWRDNDAQSTGLHIRPTKYSYWSEYEKADRTPFSHLPLEGEHNFYPAVTLGNEDANDHFTEESWRGRDKVEISAAVSTFARFASALLDFAGKNDSQQRIDLDPDPGMKGVTFGSVIARFSLATET